MANEYLKRTPTSTGNRKVWTWSSWLKKDEINTPARLIGNYSAGTTQSAIQFGYRNGSSTDGAIRLFNIISGTTDALFEFDPLFRDYSSWFHLLLSVNTTLGNADDRIIFYINGVRQKPFTSTYVASGQNSEFSFNTPLSTNGPPAIGSAGGNGEYWEGEICDVFFVDGQALTPEVFGFYKDGNGYISAGSTQSTDFRNGQWVPRTPREIKNLINDNGGFGVNGFYLPMNDSSNFGADFHTTPNSIITLKGENLPQPRNGAPETTDAYVSQLREDPYAANLVLAVPGISTSTSANLVTNGNFDSNISGWTTVQATTSWQSGLLRIIPNSGVNGGVYQSITTEVGKRYTVTMEVVAAGAAHARLHVGTSTDIDSADKYAYTSGNLNNVGVGKYTTSFTPTTTTTIIWLEVGGGQQTQVDFDNIVVRQEDAPLDYSADIKGSGTNKTLTANGNAGVGYEIPSYYGSALSFDGSGDYLSQTYNADFNFGTDDFTVEMWVYPNTVSSIDGLFAVSGGGGSVPKMAFHLNSGTPSVHYNGLTGASDIYTASAASIPAGQWSHLAYTRKGTTWTWYINGVATGTGSNSTVITFTSQPYYIGYGGEGYFDSFDGKIQDLRVYKGVAKYKGGFDVSKPYTPVGIRTWRAVSDACQNNFATLNSLANATSATLTDGNLNVEGTAANDKHVFSTFGFTSGKWYVEVRDVDQQARGAIFVSDADSESALTGTNYLSVQLWNGNITTSGRDNANLTAFSTGDILAIAYDADIGSVWLAKNGAIDTSGTANATGISINPERDYRFSYRESGGTQTTVNWNFGQNPTFSGQVSAGTYTDSNGKGLFKYQPPTGFLALCEDNLPTPAITDPGEHFKTVLYTGDGLNGRSITGVGFKPDFVWIKRRASGNQAHALHDSVRGPSIHLETSTTDPDETNNVYGALHSFDDDGFSIALGSGGGGDYVNTSGQTYVAWCWKAGGEAVTNTDGTITSQVSANQDAGFSIVSYTGTGTFGTVGHGLGKAPSLIITKHRAGTSLGDVNWNVSTSVIPGGYLELNTTAVHSSVIDRYVTAGTNTNSFPGGYAHFNDSNRTYISYCWTDIEGFSKFGSYVGNGSDDGPFVYCGFKPSFLLLKIASPAGQERDWHIYDNVRNSTNPVGLNLRPSSDSIEVNEPGIDFLSNGFKIRKNYVFSNYSGGTIIFAAFAESPFKTANAK